MALNNSIFNFLFKPPSKLNFRLYSNCAGEKADLAIIGVGPAGISASLRASFYGIKKIVVIDKYPLIGGTCINSGCVPTKVILKCSNTYMDVRSGLYAKRGLIVPKVQFDVKKMMETKVEITKNLSEYLEGSFKSKNIKIIRGFGKFSGCNQITVDGNDGQNYTVEADKIIIATGSTIKQQPGINIDEEYIISSDGAINLKKIPKRFTAIGAGIIGVELGSVWSRLGSDVTIIANDTSVGSSRIDRDIRREFLEILKNQGMKFIFNTKLLSAKKCGTIVKYAIENKENGCIQQLECDVLMLSVGRIPYTCGLNLDKVGVETDKNGFIIVKKNYETTSPCIYAVGDVSPGPMTAHKAQEDGALCVDGFFGGPTEMDYNNLPLVIYTHPEVAVVGKTEEQLISDCHPYKMNCLPYSGNARANSDLKSEGFLKTLVCSNTNRILGTHIICTQASEIINEAVVAQQFGIKAWDLSKVMHSHPTYSKLFQSAFTIKD